MEIPSAALAVRRKIEAKRKKKERYLMKNKSEKKKRKIERQTWRYGVQYLQRVGNRHEKDKRRIER